MMTSITEGGSSASVDVGDRREQDASSTAALANDSDWNRSTGPEASVNGEKKVKGMTARSAMRRAKAHAKNLVVDTMFRALARSLDAFDIFIKVLGPIFMLLALSLFTFETYTFFVYVLPLLGEDWPLIFPAFVTALGVFLLCNMLYNYLKAVCTDPGSPPFWEEEVEVENGEEKGENEADLAVKKIPKCKKCSRQKPARTHHCSICKRCVLKMDHHCPWINNCVGHNNYRYFSLFLFYLALCCFFVGVVFFDGFVESMHFRGRRRRLSFDGRQSVSLGWIMGVCILIAVCILGGFHLYLILTNQTTIEFHTNMTNKSQARMRGEYYRNPYDMGRRRNFKQVFGPSDFFTFLWAMPYIAKSPTGDGISFPT